MHSSQPVVPRCRPLLALAFLLSLLTATQWSLRAGWWHSIYPEGPTDDLLEACLEAIPRQVRSVVADFCWLRADEYMHFGPTRRLPADFIAGSYAGNTEILPFLELAIRLDPHHIDAYAILVQNLALHLNRFDDGLRLLQRGILANRDHPRIHELYGTGAHLWGFRESYNHPSPNNRQAALRYVEEALSRYRPPAPEDKLADPILIPRTYRIWQTRFLVEQRRLAEALVAWKAGGMPVGSQGGLLGEYLRRFEAGESVPALPENLLPSNASEAGPVPPQTAMAGDRPQEQPAPGGECDHTGDNCSHRQEAPAISMLERFPPHLLRHLAVLLFASVILWWLAGPRGRRTFRAS